MADLSTQSEGTVQKPIQSPAQAKLATWLRKRYESLARNRWAEEREWFQAAMFDQLKQWLENGKGGDSKRLRPVEVTTETKWPMPVSNHFSKAIAVNANMLGAALPEMLAKSDNYDAQNRRAADAAENAIDAANLESGMNVLVPILAKRVVLWGLGISKDTVAFDRSTDEVPQFADGQSDEGGQPGDPDVIGTERIPSPRLKTQLPQVFQVYLPRDCEDANLAPLIIERSRMGCGDARELYPDHASLFAKEVGDSSESLAVYFQDALRSLSNTSRTQEDDEKTTLIEGWAKWTELPKDVQDAIAAEWKDEPSAIYGDKKLSRLDAAMEFGVFAIASKDTVVQWGENPWDGDTPYTFYPWQKDVASVYPKGLSIELVPLQKQLNRIDSLMERALMSNAVVKLLIANTQVGNADYSGDPVEPYYYDNIGEGKVKPEFFGGKAYGSELMQKRSQIVADFQELSFANQASEGEQPSAGTAFRALAFMASKAEESRKTQRYLWEQAHELRARKILRMARKIWSNPRKIQTAGFNNRYGAQQIAAADLEGDYELSVIQDSSRPKTMAEKLEAFQLLVQGNMVDPTKPSTREYVLDTLGLGDLDLSNHLEYVKAERDLELVKNGQQPQTNPFMMYPIHLSVFADYIQTEEYEDMQPQVKAGVMAYAMWLQQMAAPPPPQPGMPMPGGPPNGPGLPHPSPHGGPAELAKKGGIGGQQPGHVLGQIPGQTVSPGQVQGAAALEAMRVVPQIAANN